MWAMTPAVTATTPNQNAPAWWNRTPPIVAPRGCCLSTVLLLFFRDCSQSNEHRKATPPHLRIVMQGNSSVNSTKVDLAMLAGEPARSTPDRPVAVNKTLRTARNPGRRRTPRLERGIVCRPSFTRGLMPLVEQQIPGEKRFVHGCIGSFVANDGLLLQFHSLGKVSGLGKSHRVRLTHGE